jgi:hypothetical protein
MPRATLAAATVRPTYLRVWHRGDCAVRALDTPNAFERSARRRAPMTGENTPPRPPRSGDKAERTIVVRGPSSRPGAVRAAKMAEMCEFCEHRPPPFPRPAVGRRANNDRLKPEGNSLVRDRTAMRFKLSRWSHPACSGAKITEAGTAHCSFRCCGCAIRKSLSKFRGRSHCSDYQTICKYSNTSRAVRPTINNAKSFVGTRGVRG